MKLNLRRRNIFNSDKYQVDKKNKENILIVSSSPETSSNIIFNLIHNLKETNQIDSSIIINNKGVNISTDFISAISENKVPKPYNIVNCLKNNLKDFNISISISDFTDKYNLIILPNVAKLSSSELKKTNKYIFDIISALPNNKGKEIPIFLDNIFYLTKNEIVILNTIIKNANLKGYFFITSFDKYNNSKTRILNETHDHTLVTQHDVENEALTEVSRIKQKVLSTCIKGIKCECFFYFKYKEPSEKIILKIEDNKDDDLLINLSNVYTKIKY